MCKLHFKSSKILIFDFIFYCLKYRELAKNVPKDPNDVNVVMLPLYHAFGLSSILDNLVRGLRFVLIPHFTFRNMLEAIQRHRITILPLVPAIAAQLVKHPVEKQYDLSSLRLLFCGASALGKDLHDRLTEKFECMVFQGNSFNYFFYFFFN